ncbi:MAG: membrane dipeptidase, partial [Planctomycetota bacterium]
MSSSEVEMMRRDDRARIALALWSVCLFLHLANTVRAADRPAVVVTEEALKVHASTYVFDGHNDLPWALRGNGSGRLENVDLAAGAPTYNTDIPRLRKGNVGAQFWSVYVPVELGKQGQALQTTIEQIELVRAIVAKYPETFELALTAADVDR